MQLELDVARREQLALKDRVLSHVAHELRAPLNAIGGVVMLLTDGLAGDVTASQREYLDVAQQNVAQLARMIHDLLDATRAEAGKLLITAAPLDLASLVEDTLLGLRPLAAAKDVVLDADVPATLPAFADAQRVRQVVTNLVDNAIKFTPSGGRVCVAADVEDDVALVSVADTGCGMPPEALDRIFERLHQEGPGRRHRGLGLGLYICRALVEAQGGRIWAESRPNAGSVFRFTLPRRPRGSLPAPAPSELPAPS
jgi:signal transduction histidine kinase